MTHTPNLVLIGPALLALGLSPASASDLRPSSGYVVQDDEESYLPPRVQRRVIVGEDIAAPVQRRIVERHIIERYVEEPVQRPMVRQRTVEPVFAPPMPIGPYETGRAHRPVPIVRPIEEDRYVHPSAGYRPYAQPVPERRLVRIAPPAEECRVVVRRTIDGFGYEQVTRTQVCD